MKLEVGLNTAELRVAIRRAHSVAILAGEAEVRITKKEARRLVDEGDGAAGAGAVNAWGVIGEGAPAVGEVLWLYQREY